MCDICILAGLLVNRFSINLNTLRTPNSQITYNALKKNTLKLSLFLKLSLCMALIPAIGFSAEPERYLMLKQHIFEEAYSELPRYQVTRKLFQSDAENRTASLGEDARRTLSDTSDLLGPDRGQKLLQANGICFAGYWKINQDSDFTGVFKTGSLVPIIARASTTFSGTQQSERRALGLAVKLLPNDLGDAPSLSVFTLHSVGGVTQPYVLDLSMDNEPPLGRIPRWRDVSTALKLKSTLLKADREAGSEKPSVTYRNVKALGQYNEQGSGYSPHWIRFSPATEQRIDREDFRDELRVENYADGQLIYNIDVAAQTKKKKSLANWQTIGQLVLTESVTSKACDTQLHFPHPKN